MNNITLVNTGNKSANARVWAPLHLHMCHQAAYTKSQPLFLCKYIVRLTISMTKPIDLHDVILCSRIRRSKLRLPQMRHEVCEFEEEMVLHKLIQIVSKYFF